MTLIKVVLAAVPSPSDLTFIHTIGAVFLLLSLISFVVTIVLAIVKHDSTVWIGVISVALVIIGGILNQYHH